MAADSQTRPFVRTNRDFSQVNQDIVFAARGFLQASIYLGRNTLQQQAVLGGRLPKAVLML